MKLEILTPDAKLYHGEVSYVQIPGIDGELGVLNNHAPLITSLGDGHIKIKTDSEPTEILKDRAGEAADFDYAFHVTGGTVEVLNNSVVILAE